VKLALFGYGGHAREVAAQIGKTVVFFVDDHLVDENTKPISSFDPDQYEIMVAVADCKLREITVNKLPKETKFFTFIHPTALIMDKNIKIGDGSFLGAYSILTTNVTLGAHTILNRGNQVGHDTILGDFCSLMPNSILSGNVVIGDRVYFGTNSSVREKINICNDVLIGMNGTVVKHITKSGKYVGVPAKLKNK
jgi:sugar O-acyltransferase (sialic acid O-acetyltransferase NeuD family)